MGEAGVAVLPVGFGLVCNAHSARIKVILLLDVAVLLQLLAQQLVLSLDPKRPGVNSTVSGLAAVPTVSVRFLHGQVKDWRSTERDVVVAGNEGRDSTG